MAAKTSTAARASAETSDNLRSIVDECPMPAGVVDLNELRYLAANDAAAELFGLDNRPVGEPVLQFVQDPDKTERRLRLLQDGDIHLLETTWKFRAADGSAFDRSGWAVCLAGHPDLVLAVAGPRAPAPSPEVRRAPATALTVATLDNEWTIISVSDNIRDLLGWRADQWRGRPLLGELHPGDVATFYGAVFRAARSGAGAALEGRLRGRLGDWRIVELNVVPEPSADELPSMLVTLSTGVDASGRTWDALTAGFDRAGIEVRQVLSERLSTAELSRRQLEIVALLLQGERVPSVATTLHLSQSTVRTHLGAVFQKLGVRSQQELLRSVRRTLDGPSKR